MDIMVASQRGSSIFQDPILPEVRYIYSPMQNRCPLRIRKVEPHHLLPLIFMIVQVAHIFQFLNVSPHSSLERQRGIQGGLDISIKSLMYVLVTADNNKITWNCGLCKFSWLNNNILGNGNK